MSDHTRKRVLIYTALFAGGSLLAAPSLGMGAGIVAGAAAIASLFGNTLASDIHSAVTARSASPRSNDALRALAVTAFTKLIERYRVDHPSKRAAGKVSRFFSRRADPLSALSAAARVGWESLDLIGTEDTPDHVRGNGALIAGADPSLTADDWERCLTEIISDDNGREHADAFPPAAERRALAEYIAPRFAGAVRELVQSDLDPAAGSGGRAFVALHLDLMRSMAVSLRSSNAKSDDARALIIATQRRINDLADSIALSLSPEQREASQDALEALRNEQRQTQALVAQGFASQELRAVELASTLKEVQAGLATLLKGRAEGASLDNVLQAIRDLVQSGDVRGVQAMELSHGGRFVEAASEAFALAQDENRAAEHLGDAAKQAKHRAGTRWLSAGDLAFVTDPARAIEAYLRCTEIDSSNPLGWARLGEASWWTGQLDQALRAFTTLWQSMPEGTSTLFRATELQAQQEALAASDDAEVSTDTYLWSMRGVMVAGLNIIEILSREPSLIEHWVFRLVPVDQPGEQRAPTESEAPAIVRFFSERVYALGAMLGSGAVSTEHRRILANLSKVCIERNEFERSEEYLSRARDMSVAEHDFVAEAVYLSNLGVVAMHRGQVNTAREHMAEALAICAGDSAKEPLFINFKEIRRLTQGDQTNATSIDEASTPGDHVQVCNLLEDKLHRDPVTAVKLAFKLKEIEGNVHGNLGHVAHLEGEISLARSEYRASLDAHRSIGFETGIAKTKAALSELPTE